ncbi:MAG: alpha/beta fold hydrolase [Candidatus Thiodiazotropha sp.]
MSIFIPTRSLLGILLTCCLLLTTTPVLSDLIAEQQSSGFIATAQLLPGEAQKKAILILHGFLQTRDFFTVRRLGEALHDMGYTVLLPSLTLGIDNRRQSLACEAIHSHSMDQDTEEIGFWINWLQRRTGKRPTLIGHSVGSLELLAYLDEEPDPPIEQAILISLIAFVQGPIAKENEAERQRAQQQLAHGDNSLTHYYLAYCDSYTTTPENYLSYVTWDGNKTLEVLNNLAVEPTIVLGGEDRRLGDDWLPSLRQVGVEVVEIPGANHFFDHEYEFDLVDSIQKLLER